MRRREFIVLLTGAAASPLGARAQQPTQRIRLIGALVPFAEKDKIGQSWLTMFRQRLSELGWVEGRNVGIEYRFAAGNSERMRSFATELAELHPDVILISGTAVVGVVRPLLRSIPVVFVQVTDPVGIGLIKSLAHPGGNMTGFTSFEYSMGGKWLELLKDLQPAMSRVAVVQHADNANRIGYLRAIETAASALNVSVLAPDIRQPTEFEAAFATLVHEPGIGLIVPPDSFTLSHRGVIIALASRYRLPSVYAFPPFVIDGGLMSYGVDNKDMYHRAATYVSRILNGERPSDLPVQASNKFELMLNLKAAKTIGLEVPPTLLARADEVIE
jgi:putative ABC transport system substrate-binding protein